MTSRFARRMALGALGVAVSVVAFSALFSDTAVLSWRAFLGARLDFVNMLSR